MPGPTIERTWSAPRGPYRVRVGVVIIPGSGRVLPGVEYEVQVRTLCGSEDVRIACQSREACAGSDLARRAQLVASIQHVERRSCTVCMEHWGQTLTAFERRFLYATAPRLGAILGFATGPGE